MQQKYKVEAEPKVVMDRDETVNNREELISQDGQKERIVNLFKHKMNIKKKIVGNIHYSRIYHLAEKLFNESKESECSSDCSSKVEEEEPEINYDED